MEKKTLTEYIRFIDQLITDANFAPAGHHIHYLLNQFPKCAELYPRYGRVLTELSHFDEAILFYLRAAAVYPDNWTMFFTLAVLCLNKNQPNAAARYAAYAACLEPERSEVKQLSRRLRACLPDSVHDDLRQIECIRASETHPEASAILENIADSGVSLLGALLLSARQGEDQRKVHRDILRHLPYCAASLRALTNIYAQSGDLTRFQRYADRLHEIDPEQSLHPNDDGAIQIEANPIQITYFDWTGFPNIRARTSWQRSQSRYLTIEEDQLASCFELLPLPTDFFVPEANATDEPSREAAGSILKPAPLRPIATSAEDDLFFQEDYFQRQAAQLSALASLNEPDSTKSSADTTESSEKKLEDAFDYLERIVSGDVPQGDNSFIEDALSAGLSDASADADEGAHETPSEETGADELVLLNVPEKTTPDLPAEISEEMTLELARDAWTTFSKGNHDEAIEKYRALVRGGAISARLRDDLTTLKILFPEIAALSELLSELVKKS